MTKTNIETSEGLLLVHPMKTHPFPASKLQGSVHLLSCNGKGVGWVCHAQPTSQLAISQKTHKKEI
jgi:hypothetical protein